MLMNNFENLCEFKPKGKKSVELSNSIDSFNVWEGSVRSSKTVSSLIGWGCYVLSSVENVFLMSGKTSGSLKRNCIEDDNVGFLALFPMFKSKHDSEGNWYLEFGKKKIYCVGANDKSSYKKIQGMTVGGWYADEVNLHHKDFVSMAQTRYSASLDGRTFWTLNPDVPTHWIYKDYIDKLDNGEISDNYNYHHFVMSDNPMMTPRMIKREEKKFTGFFYDRYILGKRVMADGAIYDCFTPSMIVDDIPENEKIIKVEVGLDFGKTKSPSTFVLVGYTARYEKMYVIILYKYIFLTLVYSLIE